MGYTLKDHRSKHLYEVVSWEAIKRSEARHECVLGEMHAYPERAETFGKLPRVSLGKSKIIAIS